MDSQTQTAATTDMLVVGERLAKRKSTAAATGALAKWQVVECADGSFVCSRFGMMSRPLADIDELEDFLDRATGSALRK